ncbi:unnamed protein product [Hapterophycus canaliculatus]
MARSMPNLRLLFLLRDPVDRLWSASKYILRRRLADGRANRSDVIKFFTDRMRDPSILGFRHSDYGNSLIEIEKAGLSERLNVVFQENLGMPSENDALAQAFGFDFDLNHSARANVHGEHVHGDDAVFDEAVEAFGRTYQIVRDRFGARVPA